MQKTGKLGQIEYQLHFNKRNFKLHLAGLLVDSNDEYHKFKGYCRIIEE